METIHKMIELENEAARLREELEKSHAENTRLREAIEWVLSSSDAAKRELPEFAVQTAYFMNELRARAFPPQFETVEVKTYGYVDVGGCIRANHPNRGWIAETYGEDAEIIELTGLRQRPVPVKTKHREQVFGFEGHFVGHSTHKFDHRYTIFAEWDE